MEWRTVLAAVVLLVSCAFGTAAGRGLGILGVNFERPIYDPSLAEVLVRYASAVYLDDTVSLLNWNCSRCGGIIKDFRMVELVVDVQRSLQAFVGVDNGRGAIVIAFRGTQESSMQNWMEDLYFKELDVDFPGVEDAKVHHGFYNAYHDTTLGDNIMSAVKYIRERSPQLKFMVTGHSMGGALASLCALDLIVNYEVPMSHVDLVTFGQPRLGNAVFAAYFNQVLPRTIRMVHAHDMVPHLPPFLPVLGARCYHHFAREVWITSISLGILTYEYEIVCDASGEDPNCSRSVRGNSIRDHFTYLNVPLGSEDD